MGLGEDDHNYWEQMRLGDKQALFELYNRQYFQLIRAGLKSMPMMNSLKIVSTRFS
jgi:hypothetical protein